MFKLPNNRPLRIYLAGAITSDLNFKSKFQNKLAEIREQNNKLIVYNPARLADYLNIINFSWLQYIRVALDVVPKCDFLYLFKDYVISNGAQIEYLTAKQTKKIIMIEGIHEPASFETDVFNQWLKSNYSLELGKIYTQNEPKVEINHNLNLQSEFAKYDNFVNAYEEV